MKKNNRRRLIFSLVTLIVLSVVAWFAAKKSGWFTEGNTPTKKASGEFAIKDTASIDKFVITKSSGEKATLTRSKEGYWMINEKYRAKPESIMLIMRVFKNISVKSRVGAAARNNVIKNIAAFHRKIEIYQNGELSKIWYIGNPSADRSGTYCLLETPGEGKSDSPYIMELAAFHGQLDTRFYTEEHDWKYTGLFLSNPDKIKQVKLVSGETHEEGFTLNTLPNRKLELLDADGKKVNGFDTLTARAYLFAYKRIHFEEFAKKLSFTQIDSLKKVKPYFSITVKDDKKTTGIDLYHMKNNGGAQDLEGKLLPWNPERAYGITSEGDVVVVQYYVFDKLLRPISSFMRKPGM